MATAYMLRCQMRICNVTRMCAVMPDMTEEVQFFAAHAISALCDLQPDLCYFVIKQV